MKRTCIFLISVACTALSAQHNTYYIGHSGFGWDLIVGEMVNDLAADAGIQTYDYGYQFIGGTCLTNQWYSHEEPQGGTDSRAQLATGNYDILVMAEQIPIQEVIYGSPWCHENQMTSVEVVDNYYDLATGANAQTRVYLMEFHNEVNLNNQNPYEDWVDLNAEMRPLWEQVVDSVNQLNNGPLVRIVPVAAAFQAMADSVRSGVFPGITDWTDLFDENDIAEATIHPTEATYYLVACVHFATIFGQSPEGLTNETAAAAGWAFDPPTTAQAEMMQRIAWEVVSNDSHTGVTSTGVENVRSESGIALELFGDQIFLRNAGQGFEGEELRIFDLQGRLILETSPINGKMVSLQWDRPRSGVYLFSIGDLQEKLFVRE